MAEQAPSLLPDLNTAIAIYSLSSPDGEEPSLPRNRNNLRTLADPGLLRTGLP
jgi:hypothetical protein